MSWFPKLCTDTVLAYLRGCFVHDHDLPSQLPFTGTMEQLTCRIMLVTQRDGPFTGVWPYLYNSLPGEIKMTANLTAFRAKYKAHLFTQPFLQEFPSFLPIHLRKQTTPNPVWRSGGKGERQSKYCHLFPSWQGLSYYGETAHASTWIGHYQHGLELD